MGKVWQWILRVLSWFWTGLEFLAPFSNVLWGVSIYSGICFSVYLAVTATFSFVADLNLVFASWADSVGGSIAQLFNSVNSNSVFQFLSYVLSLDVPFSFLRSSSDWLLRVCLGYVAGAALGFIEIAVAALGVLFVRSRVKKMSEGLSKPTTPGVPM